MRNRLVYTIIFLSSFVGFQLFPSMPKLKAELSDEQVIDFFVKNPDWTKHSYVQDRFFDTVEMYEDGSLECITKSGIECSRYADGIHVKYPNGVKQHYCLDGTIKQNNNDGSYTHKSSGGIVTYFV